MLLQLKIFRETLFEKTGERRITRIAACTLLIGGIWLLADFISGSLSFNLWHDLLCLVLGILLERFIVWGKTGSCT